MVNYQAAVPSFQPRQWNAKAGFWESVCQWYENDGKYLVSGIVDGLSGVVTILGGISVGLEIIAVGVAAMACPPLGIAICVAGGAVIVGGVVQGSSEIHDSVNNFIGFSHALNDDFASAEEWANKGNYIDWGRQSDNGVIRFLSNTGVALGVVSNVAQVSKAVLELPKAVSGVSKAFGSLSNTAVGKAIASTADDVFKHAPKAVQNLFNGGKSLIAPAPVRSVRLGIRTRIFQRASCSIRTMPWQLLETVPNHSRVSKTLNPALNCSAKITKSAEYC